MTRVGRSLLFLIALALLGGAAPLPAAAGGPIRAVAGGRPISLDAARSLSCHDFDFPVLTCYQTAGEMEAAAAERARSGLQAQSVGSLAAASTGYVVVYVDGAWGGSARAISQSYSYLGTIGWNDVISSLRSYGASGYFTENAPTGGFVYSFYGTSQVTYVGDTYNDKFSAVYLY